MQSPPAVSVPAAVRRRTGRRGVVIAVAAVVLLVLGLVADRTVASITAGRFAGQLACALGSRPQITLRGFPVLTQLIAGRLSRVDAHFDRYRTGGVTLTDITVVADGVRLPQGGQPEVAVGRLQAEVDVPLQQLPARVEGHPLSYETTAQGQLAVTTTVTAAKLRLPVTVLARVSLDGQRLLLHPEQVDVFGLPSPVPPQALGLQALLPPAPLPALPTGLTYRSVRVDASGLRFGIGGSDVQVDAESLAPHTKHCFS